MKLIKTYGGWVLVLVPAICFFWMFFKYMVDAPINDDYLAVLDYLNQHLYTGSYKEKISLLFSQTNEHRIVYDRVWILLTYKLFGTVNFTVLAFIGNLSFIALAAVFYRKFRDYNRNIILFLPVSVLLFNMAFWENITFAMAVMANITVVVFMLLNMHYLTVSTLKTKHIVFAALFFIAAILTQGGGLFLLPVSIFILARRKEYKKGAIYAALTIIPAILYFHNLQRPVNVTLLDFLYDYKGRAVIFVFGFLGNAFNYFMIHSDQAAESVGVTSIIGFGLFCLFLYITKTGYYKKNLFNYSIMLLVIVIACVTAYTRLYMGTVTASASRYRIYGALFVISLYFWYIETYPVQKKQLWAVLLCSIAYYLGINLTHYEYLSHRERQTLTGILFYNDGKPEFLNGEKTMLESYKSALKGAAEHGTYKFPTNKSLEYYFPYSVKKATPSKDSGTASYFSVSIGSIDPMSDCHLIEGWGFLIDHSTAGQKIYVGLQHSTEQEPVFFTARSISKFDLNPYFNKLNLKNGGFIARIRNSDIKPGESAIWMMVEKDGEVKITKTDKKITL
jgi:hypothetical protein